ncbi:Clavaminate synthase-like protein [Ganoderma leucocontextum]|nr:Clavaminate synthase-like protein [Ganoderma leucocontextum]
MPGLVKFPTFPEGVPSHPLLIIDYALLKAGDGAEIDRLWKAATELGFWYDVRASARGEDAISLPAGFKYKSMGATVIDEKGNKDTTETMDVSQDDVLAYPVKVHQAYPATVGAAMDSTVRPFVRKSMDVSFHILSIMDDRLGLPKGTLAGLSRPEERSGSTLRLIRAPPAISPSGQTFVSPHTDFGSLTILHNRLGGLQVLVPGEQDWQYVKPLEGHAICNIGDALNVSAAGSCAPISTAPPPKEQAKFERWSLVFFTRPSFDARMRALTEQSSMIAEAVANAPAGKFDTGVTAGEWLARRILVTRASRFKDGDTYKAGFKGTEDIKV